MEKKRSIGIFVLGWTLIISGLIFQCSYWLPFRGLPPFDGQHSRIYYATYPIISKLALDPLPLFIFLESKSRTAMLYVSLFRTAIVIFCGLAIFRLKNFARIILLVLSWATIISFLPIVIPLVVSFLKSGQTDWSWVHPLIVPSVYITYLTRPKVKEIFR